MRLSFLACSRSVPNLAGGRLVGGRLAGGLAIGLAGGLAGLLAAWPAFSAPGPQLKASPANAVPACFTAPKLMQHVGATNSKLDPKFRDIATHYEAQGKQLGLRWDYAFFQMLAETNNLTFSGSGAKAELSKDHNNFASIKSADRDEPDTFPDVATGVLAHLHHIRLYAGDPVAKPAAKRTKQVEGFVLSWSRQLKRPVRFDDMIGRWSPNNPGYAQTIEASMRAYQVANCGGIAEVAEVAAGTAVDEDETAPASDRRGKGKRADNRKPARTVAQPASSRSDEEPASAAGVSEPIRTAALAGNAGKPAGQPALGQTSRPPVAPPAGAPDAANAAGALASAQCKVWSASFGGDKSVLIRVSDGQVTHFTALQVNAGREKDETGAYIAAYARGGKTVGEFTSADQAINKAFELCPKT
jgi:hypothetical protein